MRVKNNKNLNQTEAHIKRHYLLFFLACHLDLTRTCDGLCQEILHTHNILLIYVTPK